MDCLTGTDPQGERRLLADEARDLVAGLYDPVAGFTTSACSMTIRPHIHADQRMEPSLYGGLSAVKSHHPEESMPPIDPNAASSPAEFFAVISEYSFERPVLVHDVKLQLKDFYWQNLIERLIVSER